MTKPLSTGTDRRAGALALLAASSLLVACGSSAVPASKLTNAQASIRAAEAVGASETPNSALYLKMAQDGVAEARRLMQDGDNEEASLALEKAQADAELSLSYAREARAREEAEAARAKIGELESEAGARRE